MQLQVSVGFASQIPGALTLGPALSAIRLSANGIERLDLKNWGVPGLNQA